MRLPPLNSIRAFEVAARLGSFSAAAIELNVRHSAVSRHVRLLEAFFGRPLVSREARGVSLTRAGRELLTAVSDGLGKIAVASDALRRNARHQTLVVGCIPSIASRWLVPMLGMFTAKHPELSVQVLYAQAEERITDGDYDALITVSEELARGVERCPLFSRASKPVASPHYLIRKGTPTGPQAILKSDLLHDESRIYWSEWFNAAGVRPKGELRGTVFADFNLLSTAVIAGHGVALCPVDMMRTEIGRGDLVVLDERTILENRSYAIFTRTPLQRGARLFRDWFAGEVRPHQSQRLKKERQ